MEASIVEKEVVVENEIKSFKIKKFEVRTINKDGTIWFIGKDVSSALGFRTVSDALRIIDSDEKGTHKVRTLGGQQNMIVINKSGFYSLILRSRKPEAKIFKKWVTNEVLPSIKETGGYIQESTVKQMTSDPIYALDKMQELIAMSMDLTKKDKALSKKAIIDKPKVEFF